jgi:hypothetical protein
MSERFAQGHVLVVGVGADLPSTVDDAIALAVSAKDLTHCAGSPVQVHMLTAEGTTHDAFFAVPVPPANLTIFCLSSSSTSAATAIRRRPLHGDP